MTLARIKRQPANSPAADRRGFTLVELVLVMTLLVVMLGYVAPSLSRFFRGRTLDSEARRFVALTRYGQSRAVSDGLPILLWIDANQRVYGLRAQTGSGELDPKEVKFTLGEDLQVEAQMPSRIQTNFWTMAPKQTTLSMPTICFLPDGFISETSPDHILLRQTRDNSVIWIGQSANHLNYEVQTNLPYARY